ncbi:MAG: glutamate--tRNA ligase family protein [Acidobacteriota bacterium]
MLDHDLIRSLFDDDLPEPAHWEARYPTRDLPRGAVVTRFGPSPTGFLHTGGVYVATIAKNLAVHSQGVYFIRIEDTDRARVVAEAPEQFARAFDYFSIQSDEDDATSSWGPYEQSKRSRIYHTYARELLFRDDAYLCFCTRAELTALTEKQQAEKVTSGYYGVWAHCRHLSPEEVKTRLDAGLPYAVRLRSPDGEPARVSFEDLIRGPIEMPESRNDAVLIKSSDQNPRLPTYHFAHAVDDHLMRVNLVLRGEEWISSVALHLQLFKVLGFDPIRYAHIAPLMKLEGASRRKLSKRNDPEANVDFYISSGYPAGAVQHYLRGLANSRLAEATFEESAAAAIRLDECGVAGPIFDLVKLESISREYISFLTVDETLEALTTWAESYDRPLAESLRADAAVTRRILEMEREPGAVRRKDLAKWSDFRAVYTLFYSSLFTLVSDPADSKFGRVNPATVRALARDFADSYRHESDQKAWFEQIRELAAAHKFAGTAGEFKKAPDNYAGSISDVSNVIRIALTGQTQSPELFRIAHVIGRDEVIRRVRALGGESAGNAG